MMEVTPSNISMPRKVNNGRKDRGAGAVPKSVTTTKDAPFFPETKPEPDTRDGGDDSVVVNLQRIRELANERVALELAEAVRREREVRLAEERRAETLAAVARQREEALRREEEAARLAAQQTLLEQAQETADRELRIQLEQLAKERAAVLERRLRHDAEQAQRRRQSALVVIVATATIAAAGWILAPVYASSVLVAPKTAHSAGRLAEVEAQLATMTDALRDAEARADTAEAALAAESQASTEAPGAARQQVGSRPASHPPQGRRSGSAAGRNRAGVFELDTHDPIGGLR